VNEYVVIKDNDDTVCDILKWTGENYVGLNTRPFKSRSLGTIKPLDEVQKCVFDSIVTNDITVLFGRSGSGKTTIPLNFIMQSLEKQTYRKCVIVYDFETLRGAKQLGYTPGSLEEKMMTKGAVGNILSSKLGDVSAVERLIASDQLQIVPTANIRGMEIGADTICYVTEAQNLDPYTLKTIIQRCKEGSKIILEGDVLDQRDVDRECGIFRLIEVFKGHKSFGCVKLKNNYRSEIGELADKL
jgi:PhoH-like ATPase